MMIDPDVGTRRPSSMAMVVVLPAPLPPKRPVTDPFSTVNETPSTATPSPKRLVSASTAITASEVSGGIAAYMAVRRRED
jgi:hypothetical protein